MEQTRPRQVTLLASMVIAASVFVIISGFERVASLRSIDSREAVSKFLSEPPGDGLGLSVERALDLLHVATMIGVGCATAIAILGIWLLRGDRSARLAASLLTVPLVLTGLATGGFLAAVVAAAVVMLWVEPARAFFEPAGAARAAAAPTTTPSAPPPTTPPPTSAPTSAPTVPPASSTPPAPYAATVGRFPAGTTSPPLAPHPDPVAPARRASPPPPVSIAALVTTIASAVVALLCVISMPLLLTTDREELLAEVYRQDPQLREAGLTPGLVVAAAVVMMLGFVVWAIAAVVLAVFVRRGKEWARILLVISAACVAVLGLVMTLAAPAVLVISLAAAGVAFLLLRPEAAEWCRERRDRMTP